MSVIKDHTNSPLNSSLNPTKKSRKIFLNPLKNKKFCSNEVETSKYTPLTWFPKSIILQFTRVNNIYFLMLSILGFFPFSPYNPYGYSSYFVLILLFTSIKDGIEDLSRHKQDKKVNTSKYIKLNLSTLACEEIECQNIKVGDIVKVKENQSFPADMIFLLSSQDRLAYVNTMNLDGETNLKEKLCVKLVENEKDLCGMEAEFEVELPFKTLHHWNGMVLVQGEKEDIGFKQLLLRGCTLKNTDWILGIVIYTGKECKVIMNGQNRISKISTIQTKINQIVYSVMGVLVIICIIFAIIGQNWLNKNSKIQAYLELDTSSDVTAGIYIFFTYWIQFSSLIPLSLYLFLEVQRLIICSFIPNDLGMYYEPTDTTAAWRTSDVVEELGQVRFIFSDKTGTLTRNEMKLEKFFIKDTIFDCSSDFESISSILITPENQYFEEVKEFFYTIGICNSVFTIDRNGEVEYHSVSPDETALVNFAAELRVKIIQKQKNRVRIMVADQVENWKIKVEIPFTSERKRMSVVAQGPSGTLTLFTKGADEVILPLIQSIDLKSVKLAIDDFAKAGLRTLVLATRPLNKTWFHSWSKKWKKLNKENTTSKEEKINNLIQEIEQDLNFCALTAIEDKLQDGVPDTINLLMRANIKLWVITGDKEETALEIAKSCNLIKKDSKTIKLFTKEKQKIEKRLNKLLSKYQLDRTSIKLIKESNVSTSESIALNGIALSYIKSDPNIEDLFFKAAYICNSLICCRMSPSQKSEIIKIVKKRGNWVTLAIGDGANDVSMLKEASVGVGIFGKEGTQAILASDFALSQFSHLQQLLLVHGRYAYYRISHFILYYFYTNYILEIGEIWLAFFTGFSGQIYYLDWIPSTYNIFVLSLPTMASFGLDQDISPHLCLKYPNLYSAGQKSAFFNMKTYWAWIFWTVIGGSIIFWIPSGGFLNGTGSEGRETSLFWNSSISYIMLVAAVNWKLLFITRSWNLYYGGAVLIGIGIMYFFMGMLNVDGIAIAMQPEYQSMLDESLSVGKSWVIIILGSLVTVMPHFFYVCIQKIFFPSPTDKIVEFVRAQKGGRYFI